MRVKGHVYRRISWMLGRATMLGNNEMMGRTGAVGNWGEWGFGE